MRAASSSVFGVAGLFVFAAFTLGRLPAQTPGSSLDQMFKQGAEAFNSGNYDRMIALFEEITKPARPGPVLEPVTATYRSRSTPSSTTCSTNTSPAPTWASRSPP